MHPEAQRKAQAEIDKVIGGDRLPKLTDQPSLPYVDALVKEVFRWNPVAPLGESAGSRSRGLLSHFLQEVLITVDPPGIPHIAAEDDFYEGYLIPKGSSVIANLW